MVMAVPAGTCVVARTSCAPMLVPVTVKSMRLTPGTAKPAKVADFVRDRTAVLTMAMRSVLTAVAACRLVVARSDRQASPEGVDGSVPCASSAADSPGTSDSASAVPSAMAGSAASTTPLALRSRTTLSAPSTTGALPQAPPPWVQSRR